MANKPLKSIKFPGLSDTYTVPEVDDTLAVTGAAADAKKVGDEISDIKADLTHIDNTLQFEFSENVTPTLSSGGYSGAVGSTISEASDNNWKRFSLSVSEGERYKIHYRALGTSGAITYIWLCDENDVIKQVFQETTSTVKEIDRIVKIGSGISKIYVRSYTQPSGTQLSIMAESSVVDSISRISEGRLKLDTSTVVNSYIISNPTIGSAIAFSSSSTSKVIKKIIPVINGHHYTVKIEEAASPAGTRNRDCAIADASNIVRQVISYTNVADTKSIIDFTAYADGYLYLCVDKNYVSIDIYGGGIIYDSKIKTDALEDDVYGEKTEAELTSISGLNLAANATKYTSSANYTTYYIPAVKYGSYLFTFVNSTASDSVVRIGFAKDVPANNIACTYIGHPSVPHTGTKTKEYEYTSKEDGYLSVSFYTGAVTSVSAVQYNGGIKAKVEVTIPSIEGLQNNVNELSANVESIENDMIDVTLNYPIDVSKFDIGQIYTQNNNVWTYATNAKRVRTKQGVALSVKKGTIVRSIDDNYQFALAIRWKNNNTLWVDWRKTPYELIEDCEIGIGIRAYPTELTVEDVDSYLESIEIIPPSIYVNNNLDKRIQLSYGSYWGSPTLYSGTVSNLTFSSSNSIHYAIVELTAGQLLKIVGRGASSQTKMYFTFRKDKGILIDQADSSDNEGESKVKFLRYDLDVTVYVNLITSGDHYIQYVDQYDAAYYESMLTEHRMRTILDLNDPVTVNMALRTLKRSPYGQTVPQVSLLHFSDLHGCDINLKRILDFANDATVSPYINNIIHTGDIFRSCLSDGYDWFNNLDGSEDILMAVGNHDTGKVINGSVDYNGASQEEVYTTLFDGKIENWGVVQPTDADTEFLSYYYKDYTSSKLRLIVLDANRGASSAYTVAQLAWFETVLQDAITQNYHVIVASHYIFDINTSTRVNCSFCDWGSGQDGWYLYDAYAQKVEDFIDDGGTFVCWLGGHIHSDRVRMYNNRQLAIAVTTSSFESERTKYSQDQRVVGKKSQDAFNIVTIHTNSSLFTLYRIGSDMGKYGQVKHMMTYDYANRKIVYEG